MFRSYLDHHQGAMFLLAKVTLQHSQFKPFLVHFAHIAVLTMYLISIIYFTDMLPQHHVYRNELNFECYNITLARGNIAP